MAFAIVCYFAVVPFPAPIERQFSDKFLHMLAFSTLTVLGTTAFRRTSPLVLAALLSASGAVIELVQMVASLNRNAEFLDWVADTAAVFITLASIYACRRFFVKLRFS